MATAKKCRYCGEWLGEGNADNSMPTQEISESETKEADLNAPAVETEPTEQQLAEAHEGESKESNDEEKAGNILGMAVWFFIFAVIGTLVGFAYDEGFNLMDFEDTSNLHWGKFSLLADVFVLVGKLPMWLGNAVSVLGECGLFILLYALLKPAGFNCKQTISGIALGVAFVNCADALSLMVTDEGGEMTVGLLILMAAVLSMVCLGIFGIKAIKNKEICDFEDEEKNYLKYTGIMCLAVIPFFIISLIMQMNDSSEDTKTIISIIGSVVDIAQAYIVMRCIIQLSSHGHDMDNDDFKKLFIPFVGMALVAGGVGYYAEKHLPDTLQKYIENTVDDDTVEEDSAAHDEEW